MNREKAPYQVINWYGAPTLIPNSERMYHMLNPISVL